MERALPNITAQIVTAGDAALLVRVGNRPGPVASRRVVALVAALDAAPPPGLVDIVPAYASVLVRFDPLIIGMSAMEAFLRAVLSQPPISHLPRGRTIRIPVSYGSDDGPDLEETARLLGLTTAELIRRHTSATYRVAFLGFLAGFPYLSGLPRSLAVPRLATPRTRVPAGSVAIAERQAGVYPVESPGGWRILGHTEMALFDPAREPPALLRTGDRVRFYPVETDAPRATAPDARPRARPIPEQAPMLKVLRPGLHMTVQDAGRPRYARYGVSASGAADPDALAYGNAVLGNGDDAAALEIVGGGAYFEALAPSVVAVTGAPCVVRVNERQVESGNTFALAAGDTLELGTPTAGLRLYLCIAGGLAVPRVMGSRATDVRARIGGLDGRALQPGDVLRCATKGEEVAGRRVPDVLKRRMPVGGHWHLRVLPGPHAGKTRAALDALLRVRFVVDARSDRVGARLRRLDGPCLGGGQMLSEGVPRGAVQVPPDGDPVILLADAQATGGYCVPAVVVSADLWQTGQLRPGDSVTFRLVSLDEAVMAARQRAEVIAIVRNQPSPSRLLRGFAEWSDAADCAMSQREGESDGN